MAFDLPLERLQRWMQAVVVQPGSAEEAVRAPEARAEVPTERLPEVILPSRTLTPTERVGIYQGMYLIRMGEALGTDFVALKHFLGDSRFDELVEGYVQAFPSRSYSLNPLGDHLPEYIKTAKGIPRPDFCYDLARLELALAHVFDARETPALSAEEISAVPHDAWEAARLVPIAALELLSFRYPVSEYLQSVKNDDHDHPKARQKDTFVVVHRRNHGVYRQDLTRAAHDLLADILAGTPVGRAVEKAVLNGGRRPPREDELFRWFREWVSGGIFRSVTTAP
jgi:hypothetical protein